MVSSHLVFIEILHLIYISNTSSNFTTSTETTPMTITDYFTSQTSYHPTTICILDSSVVAVPENVALDGEYKQQTSILINDHPVWLKEGHSGVLTYSHSDLYIWLSINHSWIVGTDYNNDSSVDIECILNDTTHYIQDPTLCGNNWYRNGIRQYNISSHDGICNAGDTFICVESGITHFQMYYAGRYRQYHKNVQYYISETAAIDSTLSIGYNVFGTGRYWWLFDAGLGGIEAFGEITTQEMLTAPWSCNGLWIVRDSFTSSYIQTILFDVDECSHPNITHNITVYYPEILCLSDPYHKKSFYQNYYGIYILDDTIQYDGRYIYKNKRLNSSLYIIFVDEYDRWMFDDEIPLLTVPTTIKGYCDENVDTPDQCTNCWHFIRTWMDSYSIQCDVTLLPINNTLESDCIGEIPMNNVVNYTQEITVCFEYKEYFGGTYTLQHNISFNDRAVWSRHYMNDTLYIYYSEQWRYWVAHSSIIQYNDRPLWDMICLLWDEYEPWNCSEWYADSTATIHMTISTHCTFSPTEADTTTMSPGMSPVQTTETVTETTVETSETASETAETTTETATETTTETATDTTVETTETAGITTETVTETTEETARTTTETAIETSETQPEIDLFHDSSELLSVVSSVLICFATLTLS